MARLFKTNGTVIEVNPENGTDFTFEETRKLIGAEWLEIVRAKKSGHILIVDEEGLLNMKPINANASRYTFGSLLVGDALMCKKEEF